MPVFSGNTTTSAIYAANGIPQSLIYFSIVNKSGSTATINVSINNEVNDIDIIPKNMQLDGGEALISTDKIKLLNNYNITISTDQSVDYYFNFE